MGSSELIKKTSIQKLRSGFKNRGRISIFADILSLTRSGCAKSRLMYSANLSYSTFKGYLQFLQECSLIRKETNDELKTVYKITDKGFKFLEIYNEIQELAEVDEARRVEIPTEIFGWTDIG